MLRFLLVALLCLAAAALPPMASSARAAPVETAAWQDDGFGRIIFNWPSAPDHSARVEAGVLIIGFAKRYAGDIGVFKREMPLYVADARQDDSGRVLRLALTTSFRVRSYQQTDRIVVDLLPPTWRGAPPPPPEEVTETAEEEASEEGAEVAVTPVLPKPLFEPEPAPPFFLNVRVGQHPTFSRIVFDWNRPTGYKVSREGEAVRIDFALPAETDLTRLRVDPPKFVTNGQIVEDAEALSVIIDVVEDAQIRHFREGTKIVFDVSGPRDADVIASSDAPEAEEETSEADAPIVASAEEAIDLAEGPAATDEETAPQADEAADESAGEAAGATADETGDEAGDEIVAGEPGNESTAEEGLLDAVAETPGDAEPDQISAAEGLTLPPEEAPVVLRAETLGAGLRLTLPFGSHVSGAVFQRAQTLWLVFDEQRDIDLGRFVENTGGRFSSGEVTPIPNGVVVRMELARPSLVSAQPRQDSWVVTVGDSLLEPAAPVELLTESDEDEQAFVAANLTEGQNLRWLKDPKLGDRFAVVTAFGPSRGVISPRRFVEFTVLRTAHGLAVEATADDLMMSVMRDQVVITRPDGLTLSDNIGTRFVAGRRSMGDWDSPGFIDFVNWRREEGGSYFDTVQELHRAVAASTPDLASAAQLDLVRFYVANYYGSEALGILKLLESTDPAAMREPHYKALRGVALAQMGRAKDALGYLADHALQEDPHARLWRGWAELELGKATEAYESFEKAAIAFERYPPQQAARFRLWAARAALANNDTNLASFHMDHVESDHAPKDVALGLRLLEGQIAERLGRSDDALAAYEDVATSRYRPLESRAVFLETALRHELGQVDSVAATEKLETIRYSWRGDQLELEVLRELGKIYIAQGDYRSGLTAMRSAGRYYGSTEAGRYILSEMNDIFAELFLYGGVDDLPPIKALALYYDFRDLTPIGRQGDEMIRKLTDRLVSVDLLPQAAELLEHQIKHRLRGAQKAQVATRLAVVYLLNREPRKALQAIRKTRQTRLPQSLNDQRRLLEARALADLKRYDHAIELIERDTSEEAQMLRTDVLWRAQRWQEAATANESYVGRAWTEEDPLSEDERFHVMRAAIAYSLASDRAGLDRLRAKFGDKMADSPDAQAFAIVTEPIEKQGVAFRDLAREIAKVDTLEAFMTSFRDDFDLPKPEPVIN